MRVVLRRTVVGDIGRRFDNLSGSHHQSHVNCVSSVYGIYVSGQLSRDVIGCFKSNRWLGRDVIGCWFIRSCCETLIWDPELTEAGSRKIPLCCRMNWTGRCPHALRSLRKMMHSYTAKSIVDDSGNTPR